MTKHRRPSVAENPASVAAVAIGLLSLPAAVTLVFGVVLGLTAVILGFVGVARATALAGSGQGLAVAGIVTGALGISLPVALSFFLRP